MRNFLYAFVLLLTFLGTATPTFAQITFADDSLALLRLREKTGAGTGAAITGWMNNVPAAGRWLPSVPAPDWAGLVWVDDASGNRRVKSINLSGLGLTDSLPTDFFIGSQLDSLESLSLAGNSIQYAPSAPWFTQPNSQFKSLNISNNNFDYDSTMFAKMLGNANAMNEIEADNYLSVTQQGRAFPIIPTALPELKTLRMSDNGFIGKMPNPATLGPNIEAVFLNRNQFSTIDTTGGIPTQLRVLHINENELDNIVYLAKILQELPQLRDLSARDAMDGNTHHLQDLGGIFIASDFDGGSINLGKNRLLGQIGLNANEFSKLKHLVLDSNLLVNILPPSGILDSLQTLDLGHNQIFVQMDTFSKMFMRIPAIEKLKLNNNNIVGKLPRMTILNAMVFPPLDNLKELDISNNLIFGRLHLDQFFKRQMQSGNPKIQSLNLSGNHFSEIVFNNLGQVPFNDLSSLNVSRNRLSFADLYNIAKGMKMVKVTTNGFFDYYAPANNPTDSLAFDYRLQRPRGVGGIRRRPSGKDISFDALNPDPNYGTDSTLWNTYTWYQAPDSAINPGGHTLLARFSPSNGAVSFLPGFNVAPFLGGQRLRNILVAENISGLVHGNKNYYAIVTNDSFPLVQIPADSRRLIVGSCFDDLGKPIECQQILVQFDESYLNGVYNPDSVRAALREELGVTVIDSCLCGAIELWELSDTANLLQVEQFGTGTNSTAGQARQKTELLSADPNYALLAGSTGTYIPPTNYPSGSPNPNPTLVAIIDSGTDYDHPDLVNRIWVNAADTSQNGNDEDADCLEDNGWGYDFLNETNNPYDDHGHGTQVAGIITGQSTYNVAQNLGIYDSIAILPLKYTNKDGEGTVFHAACAIRHAADYSKYNGTSTSDSTRVRVINASWGYYGEPVATLYNAIEYAAYKYDMLFVTSAGNEAIDNDTAQHYPSNFDLPNIITVAATQNTANGGNPELLETYSNFGTTQVDIAAIGYDETTDNGILGLYANVQGTSFATAQVSRVAALLFHAYPDATYCTVKEAIRHGAIKLNSSDSTKLAYKGRIDYNGALSVLDTMTDRTFCVFTTGTEVVAPAVNEMLFFDNIRIYPNPFREMLNVDINMNNTDFSDASLQLGITNINGQTLYNKNLVLTSSAQIQIPMQDLPAGIYFLKIQFGNQQKVEKVIKF